MLKKILFLPFLFIYCQNANLITEDSFEDYIIGRWNVNFLFVSDYLYGTNVSNNFSINEDISIFPNGYFDIKIEQSIRDTIFTYKCQNFSRGISLEKKIIGQFDGSYIIASNQISFNVQQYTGDSVICSCVLKLINRPNFFLSKGIYNKKFFNFETCELYDVPIETLKMDTDSINLDLERNILW